MSTYAKIEHNLYDNPKIVGLSSDAFRAYIEGILYSGKNLTDGFLDERIVSRMWGNNVADELTTNDPVNPSWQRVDGGYLIYGFTERQNTKEHVESVKKKRKEAAQKRWDDAKSEQSSSKDDAKFMQNECKTDAKGMPYTDTDTNTDTDTDTNIESVEKKSRETRLPKDWTPTKAHYDLAKTLNVDIAREAEMFRLHAETYDRKATIWNAAFTTWLKKSKPSLPANDALDPNWWMYQQTLETR